VNDFQFFRTQDNDQLNTLFARCISKYKGWQVPLLYIYNPKQKRGFFQFYDDCLILSEKAYNALEHLLQTFGEIFPFQVSNKSFYYVKTH
jgi:hypothetical protein